MLAIERPLDRSEAVIGKDSTHANTECSGWRSAAGRPWPMPKPPQNPPPDTAPLELNLKKEMDELEGTQLIELMG
ncbi:unnamed protein product, partial [Mesorhabditis belari]|uniref:Uncharacterized protein n=1 Tax=Mesorhabditis belari TaxID=2138241 RepID=A0AAF3EUK4_9BILA